MLVVFRYIFRYIYIYVKISRPRSIHFATTTLPQDTRVFKNWHGVYESGRGINLILLIYPYSISLIRKCERGTLLFNTYV